MTDELRVLTMVAESVYKISKALVEFSKKGYDPGGIDEAIEMAEIYVQILSQIPSRIERS